ncbi:hypothetical protein ABZ412_34260 [Nocardia sp. NPDC005746]|uniref:hypothetical protein n=1 Tax=Nocardia sp. NPDC005746 TaxID=3157062 RepID=UPI00340262C0
MRGGARNRSGPQPDPRSARSDRRGLQLTALPSEGYSGDVPEFPLPRPKVREKALWRLIWTYPQAVAWAREPWRWETVAMYVRWKVRAELADATAADATAMRQLGDQIGLTPAGLKENGWCIAVDEVSHARAAAVEKPPAATPSAPTRRLRAMPGGGA